MILFSCNHCRSQMQIGAEHAGLQTRCPRCQNVVLIPAASTPQPPLQPQPASSPHYAQQPQQQAPASPPPSASEKVRVRCPHCQRVGNLPQKNLGKMIACPQCKQKFQATAPGSAPQRSASPAGIAPVPIPPVSQAPSQGMSATPAAAAHNIPTPAGQPGVSTADTGGSTPLPSRPWAKVAPVAFLAAVLLGTFVRDFVVLADEEPSRKAENNVPPPPPKIPFKVEPGPTIKIAFHERPFEVRLSAEGDKPRDGGTRPTTGIALFNFLPTMRFGFIKLDENGANLGQLTYKDTGWTNNTVVQIDGEGPGNGLKGWRFGFEPLSPVNALAQRAKFGPRPPGKWITRSELVEGDSNRRKSIWYYERQKVEVTQLVEIVEGVQTGRKDTCLIRYALVNKDTMPHRVGLRFLLDTFIGSNDGVPFLIPGENSELCSTFKVLEGLDIPDYIEAWERADPENRGTIARIQFRMGGTTEAPTRVVLGSYPQGALAALSVADAARYRSRLGTILEGPDRTLALQEFAKRRLCQQDNTHWDVPILPMNLVQRGGNGDSAVVLYWPPQELKPNQKRVVGFSYGLGDVKGKGQLVLSLGGSFKTKDEFTVTAYVYRRGNKDKVTLQLPSTFQITRGAATQDVPSAPVGSAPFPVTWRVRAPGQAGQYQLQAKLESGTEETQSIRVTEQGINKETRTIFD